MVKPKLNAMKAEKIFKREDGNQVKVTAHIFIEHYSNSTPMWSVSVETREKGKKNWLGVHSENDYTWRRLSTEDRRAYVKDEQLKHVTEAEIQEVKMELWLLLKPQP